MINVVNKYKHKPTDGDIYIGRGSIFGNPFSHIKGTKARFIVATREDAINEYRNYIMEELNSNYEMRNELMGIKTLSEMKNVNLVCFCKPKSCHGDALKEIIEQL